MRSFEAWPLADLVDRIDWTPLFAAWELRGAYPAILDDPRIGAAASDLHRDATSLLARIVDEGLLRASAAVGFWPANATADDDIVVWASEARDTELARVPALQIGWGWAAALTLALMGFLIAGGVALWRTTRFG